MLRRQQDEPETSRQGEASKHLLVVNLRNLCKNVGATEHPTTNRPTTNPLAAIGRLAARHHLPTTCTYAREHTALRLPNRILTAPDTRSTDIDKDKAHLTQYQSAREAPTCASYSKHVKIKRDKPPTSWQAPEPGDEPARANLQGLTLPHV